MKVNMKRSQSQMAVSYCFNSEDNILFRFYSKISSGFSPVFPILCFEKEGI
jgi:hypothetical protein